MKNRILLLLVFVAVMFAAVAAGQDDADATAEAKKAKQAKPAGYLDSIYNKRKMTIAYVNAFVNHRVKKIKEYLAYNDFDKAFELNTKLMTIVNSRSEILGDEICNKHKAVISEQYDMIVRAEKEYLEGTDGKREITIRYIDLFVNDKVDKLKKVLADNDFDRAFVRNSEIMLLIHKKREVLGGLYKGHKAVFLSQHDMIVKAAKKYEIIMDLIEESQELRRKAELERKKAVKKYLDSADNHIRKSHYDKALALVEKVLMIDTENNKAVILEILLKDVIRWEGRIKLKQQIRELELKAQNPKPCKGCSMPKYEDITYPDTNNILPAKKFTNPENHKSAAGSPADQSVKNEETIKQAGKVDKAGDKVE